MNNSVIKRLYNIVSAVAPIEGISIINESLKQVRIDYLPEATDAQKLLAQQEVARFDWRKRKIKSDDKLSAELLDYLGPGLSLMKLAQLVIGNTIENIKKEPDYLRKRGVLIDGDEPDI